MRTDFAAKVQALSRHRKISQDNLAPILGVTQSRVSQLLRAKEIKLSQAFALAKLFEVSLDYLADPSIPVRPEEELVLERRIHDVMTRLGPRRTYDRLILAEHVESPAPTRPQGLPTDGVHGPDLPESEGLHGVHKHRRKTSL